jgi:hypothetical protein
LAPYVVVLCKARIRARGSRNRVGEERRRLQLGLTAAFHLGNLPESNAQDGD